MDLEQGSSSSVNVDLLILSPDEKKLSKLVLKSCTGAWLWKLL